MDHDIYQRQKLNWESVIGGNKAWDLSLCFADATERGPLDLKEINGQVFINREMVDGGGKKGGNTSTVQSSQMDGQDSIRPISSVEYGSVGSKVDKILAAGSIEWTV